MMAAMRRSPFPRFPFTPLVHLDLFSSSAAFDTVTCLSTPTAHTHLMPPSLPFHRSALIQRPLQIPHNPSALALIHPLFSTLSPRHANYHGLFDQQSHPSYSTVPDKSSHNEAPKSQQSSTNSDVDNGKPSTVDKQLDDKAAVVPEGRIQQGWKMIKDEVSKFWNGCKMLKTQVVLAYKLIMESTDGKKKLSSQEKLYLRRTILDMFRLLPTLAMIMLPGGTVLLPLVMKYFPDTVPTAFKSKDHNHHASSVLTKEARFKATSEVQTMMKSVANHMHIWESLEAVEGKSAVDSSDAITDFSDHAWLRMLRRTHLLAIANTLSLPVSSVASRNRLVEAVSEHVFVIDFADRNLFGSDLSALSDEEILSACKLRGIAYKRLDNSTIPEQLSPEQLRNEIELWLLHTGTEKVSASLLIYWHTFHKASDNSRLPQKFKGTNS